MPVACERRSKKANTEKKQVNFWLSTETAAAMRELADSLHASQSAIVAELIRHEIEVRALQPFGVIATRQHA